MTINPKGREKVKTGKSEFLEEKRGLLKELIGSLQNDFPHISILGTDVGGKQYRVMTTGVTISDSMWTERGFVLRLHDGEGFYEYAFNEIEEGTVKAIAQDVREKATLFRQKMNALNIKPVDAPFLEESAGTIDFEDEVAILPGSYTPGEIVERLSKLKDRAHKSSDEVVNVMAVMENVRVRKLFLSDKKDLSQSYIWSQGYLYVLARRENKTKYSIKGFSGLKGLEILDEMQDHVEAVVENARKLLSAQPIEPGVYDVVCSPSVAGLIAHEAFGHGVEMDMFVKGRAKAVEYLGKPVASELVTMHDGAKGAREVTSYAFDDEGTLAQDTIIIDRGILKRGLSDVISASITGTQPTGNGKRESFERKVYARMTNTYFSPGKDNLENMIASIDDGYLLEDYYGGMEDPKNWGIQCLIAQGKEIKNGKFTGKIVSPVMMTGYVPTLLKSISMVSSDFELSGTGACGKGHKEWVKVSTGGPYIKAKARLG
jgi:TldD protein